MGGRELGVESDDRGREEAGEVGRWGGGE